MIFSFYSKQTVPPRKLLYIADEYSLAFEPFDTNVSAGILFGSTTELGVIRETGEIVSFYGYSPKKTWIRHNLTPPSASKGSLFVSLLSFTAPLNKGECIEYDRHCLTFYDEKLKYICIGDYETRESDDCICFAGDIVAVVREGSLVAIWANIEEI